MNKLKWIIIINGIFDPLNSTKMGLVVGIGGVSRAGKTTLANLVQNWYSDLQSSIVPMDNFVFPIDKIPKINNEVDWEVPASVDYEKLYNHLTTNLPDNNLVIAEGILIFNNDRLNSIFNKKINIEIPKEVFIERKSTDTRWSEPDWYIQHIWDAYLTYGVRSVDDALIVDGCSPFDKVEIMNYLNI